MCVHVCWSYLHPPLPGPSSRSLGPRVTRGDAYRLSTVRASGISGVSWAAAAVRSTSDGGIFYVQLPLSSG